VLSLGPVDLLISAGSFFEGGRLRPPSPFRAYAWAGRYGAAHAENRH
jgi:hypothetical protein